MSEDQKSSSVRQILLIGMAGISLLFGVALAIIAFGILFTAFNHIRLKGLFADDYLWVVALCFSAVLGIIAFGVILLQGLLLSGMSKTPPQPYRAPSLSARSKRYHGVTPPSSDEDTEADHDSDSGYSQRWHSGM